MAARRYILLACLGFTGSVPSFAVPVEYIFTGEVTLVSAGFPPLIAVGEPVVARFSYDTDHAQLVETHSEFRRYGFYPGAFPGMSISFESAPLSFGGVSGAGFGVSIFNNSFGEDLLSWSGAIAAPALGPDAGWMLDVGLIDTTAAALSDLSLPQGAIDGTSFDSRVGTVRLFPGTEYFDFNINTVQFAPLPGGGALLACGVALASWRRRRVGAG